MQHFWCINNGRTVETFELVTVVEGSICCFHQRKVSKTSAHAAFQGTSWYKSYFAQRTLKQLCLIRDAVYAKKQSIWWNSISLHTIMNSSRPSIFRAIEWMFVIRRMANRSAISISLWLSVELQNPHHVSPGGVSFLRIIRVEKLESTEIKNVCELNWMVCTETFLGKAMNESKS